MKSFHKLVNINYDPDNFPYFPKGYWNQFHFNKRAWVWGRLDAGIGLGVTFESVELAVAGLVRIQRVSFSLGLDDSARRLGSLDQQRTLRMRISTCLFQVKPFVQTAEICPDCYRLVGGCILTFLLLRWTLTGLEFSITNSLCFVALVQCFFGLIAGNSSGFIFEGSMVDGGASCDGKVAVNDSRDLAYTAKDIAHKVGDSPTGRGKENRNKKHSIITNVNYIIMIKCVL